MFATLASQKGGYGNLMLTPEQQAEFVRDKEEACFEGRSALRNGRRVKCSRR
jgi:hypothetical protein